MGIAAEPFGRRSDGWRLSQTGGSPAKATLVYCTTEVSYETHTGH